VFLFKAATLAQSQDWRQGSRYRFHQMNGGNNGILSKNGGEGMTRVVGRLVTDEMKTGDSRFKRIAWFFPTCPSITLLQVFIYFCNVRLNTRLTVHRRRDAGDAAATRQLPLCTRGQPGLAAHPALRGEAGGGLH
jgi:hypothetical protein